MHHGKQVVWPFRQPARPVVAVGDEIEGADAYAEFVDALVGTSQTLMPLAV
jgi:hypothetical protein